MPISKDEFYYEPEDINYEKLAQDILTFLSKDPEHAYSAEEIMDKCSISKTRIF